MCAATAAAIGTAVATVAAGAISATQAGKSGGGGGGAVSQQMLKGFPPATGMQSYTARMLAMNADKRPPTFDEWTSSGGKARYDWDIPDFTPMEAKQLRMVGEGGEAIPTYDPVTGKGTSLPALNLEQMAYLGRMRRRRRFTEPHGEDFAVFPEEELSRLYDRQQRLMRLKGQGSLNPQQEKALGRLPGKIQNIVENPTKYTAGPAQEEKSGMGFMDMFSMEGQSTPPWELGEKKPTGNKKRTWGY